MPLTGGTLLKVEPALRGILLPPPSDSLLDGARLLVGALKLLVPLSAVAPAPRGVLVSAAERPAGFAVINLLGVDVGMPRAAVALDATRLEGLLEEDAVVRPVDVVLGLAAEPIEGRPVTTVLVGLEVLAAFSLVMLELNALDMPPPAVDLPPGVLERAGPSPVVDWLRDELTPRPGRRVFPPAVIPTLLTSGLLLDCSCLTRLAFSSSSMRFLRSSTAWRFCASFVLASFIRFSFCAASSRRFTSALSCFTLSTTPGIERALALAPVVADAAPRLAETPAAAGGRDDLAADVPLPVRPAAPFPGPEPPAAAAAGVQQEGSNDKRYRHL